MKTVEIKNLLDAFYNGETTPEDENKLLLYFSKNNVDPEFEDDRLFFLQLYESDNIKMPESMSDNLRNLIDDLAEEEKKTNKKRMFSYFRIGGIAAGVAMLLSAGIYMYNTKEDKYRQTLYANETLKDTYTDPDEAYAKTERALLQLCSNFNKGICRLNVVEENIEKTNDILNKTFNR